MNNADLVPSCDVLDAQMPSASATSDDISLQALTILSQKRYTLTLGLESAWHSFAPYFCVLSLVASQGPPLKTLGNLEFSTLPVLDLSPSFECKLRSSSLLTYDLSLAPSTILVVGRWTFSKPATFSLRDIVRAYMPYSKSGLTIVHTNGYWSQVSYRVPRTVSSEASSGSSGSTLGLSRLLVVFGHDYSKSFLHWTAPPANSPFLPLQATSLRHWLASYFYFCLVVYPIPIPVSHFCPLTAPLWPPQHT